MKNALSPNNPFHGTFEIGKVLWLSKSLVSFEDVREVVKISEDCDRKIHINTTFVCDNQDNIIPSYG